MAGAASKRSTLPPQCGHFFRCGPETFSIFSVLLPHFAHWYSYRGTAQPPNVCEKCSIYQAAMARKRMLDCSDGASTEWANGLLVSGRHAHRQSGRYYFARVAHPEGSRPDRL